MTEPKKKNKKKNVHLAFHKRIQQMQFVTRVLGRSSTITDKEWDQLFLKQPGRDTETANADKHLTICFGHVFERWSCTDLFQCRSVQYHWVSEARVSFVFNRSGRLCFLNFIFFIASSTPIYVHVCCSGLCQNIFCKISIWRWPQNTLKLMS